MFRLDRKVRGCVEWVDCRDHRDLGSKQKALRATDSYEHELPNANRNLEQMYIKI